ncbi:MAG: hypothetical protein AAF571_00495 [Verrucomicrobiota bacterium]
MLILQLMTLRLIFFCIALTWTVYPVFAENAVITKIQTHAEKCSQAFLDERYDLLVDYTHPKIVKMMGGREKMIQRITKGSKEIFSGDFAIQKVSIGTPQIPEVVGDSLLSIVPQSQNIKTPEGILKLDSHLLAISEDNGERWYFIDIGPINQSQFEQLFPEYAKAISLPEKTRPQLAR